MTTKIAYKDGTVLTIPDGGFANAYGRMRTQPGIKDERLGFLTVRDTPGCAFIHAGVMGVAVVSEGNILKEEGLDRIKRKFPEVKEIQEISYSGQGKERR